ncbi:MAG: LytTR family DNA-binding domain-containing protein [Bacteroidales bacterium]|nr:LytTR family DNA-binding domain-containing protein [Bacteroidales bacterium]
MNVLIIEDEPLAQQELIRLLNSVDPDIDVLDCIDSVEESVKWFESNQQADLVFMDIQLSDGLSFEIFDRIEVGLPVIFTTAYDEYALKAFRVNSIDYLLKPIEEEELVRSLKKFRKVTAAKDSSSALLSNEQLRKILSLYKPAYKTRLVVKLGDKIRHIETKDIACFYSEDKVTFLKTTDNHKYILNYSLEQIEKFVNPDDFYRLNRKYIANIHSIDSIDKYFNSRLKIELKPMVEDDVLISRAKVAEFLNWLER